jgi:hypothetical protein
MDSKAHLGPADRHCSSRRAGKRRASLKLSNFSRIVQEGQCMLLQLKDAHGIVTSSEDGLRRQEALFPRLACRKIPAKSEEYNAQQKVWKGVICEGPQSRSCGSGAGRCTPRGRFFDLVIQEWSRLNV